MTALRSPGPAGPPSPLPARPRSPRRPGSSSACAAARGAARLPQLAGVAAVGLDGDEGLRDEALVLLERLHRGGLPGGVAVEGVDDLTAELVLVHEQTAQHADVLGSERGAAGGDGGRDAG